MTLYRFGGLFLSWELGVHCLAGLEVFVSFLQAWRGKQSRRHTEVLAGCSHTQALGEEPRAWDLSKLMGC